MINIESILLILILFGCQPKSDLKTFKSVQHRDSEFCELGVDFLPDSVYVFRVGCSWYCGGIIVKVSSSNRGKDAKDFTAQRVHDFDLTTAWIADKSNDNEYIEYTIDTTCRTKRDLGITELIIANGYKKSVDLWRSYSRVKRLKLYVDNKPYSYIDLLDSYEIQTVDIDKIKLSRNKILRLKFEIIETYRGDKYPRVAISELGFDGTGSHGRGY
jgi:hypothetical protein